MLATSFERIHRANLIGMGVLPLQFNAGQSPHSLGLTGEETYTITGLAGMDPLPRQVTVRIDGRPPGSTDEDSTSTEFTATVRIDTPAEAACYRHGGILPYVLRQLLRADEPHNEPTRRWCEMPNVAINGLGRIGRAALKILLDADGLDLVAVNDIADVDNLAYLLKYDTVYGRYHRKVSTEDGALLIDGRRIAAFAERDPANLPWADLGVDLVLECTGVFKTEDDLRKHMQAGASYVILSAPTTSEAVPTVVHGVNRPDGAPQIISCASCTTNCITPVIEIAHRHIGVQRAVMTTIHAYTAGQQLVDGPAKSFRRGRAGAANLVPTSTGAARATTRAVPELAGRFDGIAVRAPIPVGSIADIVFVANRPTTVEEVNDAFRQEATDRALPGHSRCLGGSAGLRRHRRRPTRRRHRPGPDPGRGRHAGQGDGLVRQRMGLHPPDDPRGPQHARRGRMMRWPTGRTRR